MEDKAADKTGQYRQTRAIGSVILYLQIEALSD
jgi:hypothetical protein